MVFFNVSRKLPPSHSTLRQRRGLTASYRTSSIINYIKSQLQRWQRALEFSGQTLDAFSTASSRPAVRMPDGNFILAQHRKDGVGIQAFLRICVMQLARSSNAHYVHVPFAHLGHRENDLQGRTMSDSGWAAAWERQLNLGQNELSFTDLHRSWSRFGLLLQLSRNDPRLFDPEPVNRPRLLELIRGLRTSQPRKRAVHIFGLGISRHPEMFDLHLDAALIDDLSRRFARNGSAPSRVLFTPGCRNVAVHIRRGDAWQAVQQGSRDRQFHTRILSESYYIDLIRRLSRSLACDNTPLCFHIFSDGTPDDFRALLQAAEGLPANPMHSAASVEIRLHTEVSAMDSLWHLANADILVPGKSSFSVLAIILGRTRVMTDSPILEFYQYAALDHYMRNNERFTQIA